MKQALEEALAEVEPIDPGHYFGGVSRGKDLLYGLVEAKLPPVVDELVPEEGVAHVVVAEDANVGSDDELHDHLPVLTMLFEQDSPEDIEAGIAHVELLVDERTVGDPPNPIFDSPKHAEAIIRAAMARFGVIGGEGHSLSTIIAREDDVEIPPEGFVDRAAFLGAAGFERVESPGQETPDTYELRLAA